MERTLERFGSANTVAIEKPGANKKKPKQKSDGKERKQARHPAQSVLDLIDQDAEASTIIHQLETGTQRFLYSLLMLVFLLAEFPTVTTTNLSPEDEAFFVAMCKGKGKPVPFIPTIDGDLKFWMKKDSLWFAEDLRSVPDQDPERVMILQGAACALHLRWR